MLDFFVAKKIFQGDSQERETVGRASVPAVRLATWGIAVGLSVMILSVCIVKGFQIEVSGKLAGFVSHLEILDVKSFSSPENYPVAADPIVLDEIARVENVQHIQRFSQKIGIFKTKDDFAGIALKGIAQDYETTFIRQNLVAGKIPDFRDDRASDSVVISRLLAEKLRLSVGDKIFSYFFSETIKQRRFVVAGIFDTHLPQFDKTVVLTDLYTVNRLNQWNVNFCSGVEIAVSDMGQLDSTQANISEVVDKQTIKADNSYRVLSLRENPNTASILAWLDLLDFNVLVILVIMICVSGFAMVSGLMILILERTNTIGVLKALGATNMKIQSTFLWLSSFIVIRGLLLGNMLGLFICAMQYRFKFIRLNPETYYVDIVPIYIDYQWILLLNILSLLITMAVLVIPSFLVARVEPAKTIRFD